MFVVFVAFMFAYTVYCWCLDTKSTVGCIESVSVRGLSCFISYVNILLQNIYNLLLLSSLTDKAKTDVLRHCCP